MADFFNLPPEGVGGLEVESFPSYFHRLAQLHSATPLTFSTALSQWWQRKTSTSIGLPSSRLYDGKGSLAGYGDAVGRYVGIVSHATGRHDIARTTLLALHGVSDRFCHGVLAKGRQWCPSCFYESKRDGKANYDRLIWSMLAMKRCPIHSVVLQSSCPHCGLAQKFYNTQGEQDQCFRCQQSLLRPPSEWSVDHGPGFGEADCCRLVGAISDGTLTDCTPNAFRKFCAEIVSVVVPALALRRNLAWAAKEDPRRWKLRAPPTFETMLKRCHLLGVSLVDVLIDPVSAARAAGELEFLTKVIPTRVRPRRPETVEADIRGELVALMALPESESVPSFAEICRKHAVSTGYVRYRMGSLLAQYNRRVRLQNLRMHGNGSINVARWLRSPEYQKMRVELGQCEKRIVEYAATRFCVSAHVVRGALSSFHRAQGRRTHTISAAAKKKGRANKRIVMNRPRKAVLNGLASAPRTVDEIAERVGATTDRTRQVLRSLEDASCVAVIAKRRRKLVYCLTQRGAGLLGTQVVTVSLLPSDHRNRRRNVKKDAYRSRTPRSVSLKLQQSMLAVLSKSIGQIGKTKDLADALGLRFEWLADAFHFSYGIRCGTWIVACKLSRADWLIRKGKDAKDAARVVGLDIRTLDRNLSGPVRVRGETLASWGHACPAVNPGSDWIPGLPVRDSAN